MTSGCAQKATKKTFILFYFPFHSHHFRQLEAIKIIQNLFPWAGQVARLTALALQWSDEWPKAGIRTHLNDRSFEHPPSRHSGIHPADTLRHITNMID